MEFLGRGRALVPALLKEGLGGTPGSPPSGASHPFLVALMPHPHLALRSALSSPPATYRMASAPEASEHGRCESPSVHHQLIGPPTASLMVTLSLRPS